MKADKWYAKKGGPIDYVVSKEIMAGTSETTFSPDSDCTREMLVQILYNSEGKPGKGASTSFTDVKDGWYYAAVTWAYANNITKGTSTTTFGVGQKLTRQEVARFLMNYAAFKGKDVTVTDADLSKYADRDNISSWAIDAIKWANVNGILNGKKEAGVNLLDPKGNATRAEIAQMIKNYQINCSGQ